MSGTNRRKSIDLADDGPVIILIEPQLGENIGMVARAMLNCGLTELRLVRPRDVWPNEKARRTASGADQVLEGAVLFERTEDAIADLNLVYAATARPRDMAKPVVTPAAAAEDLRQAGGASQGRAGVIFGGEAMGLNNDDIALADTIITAPLNPGFTSLNLAQAVLIVTFAWYQAGDETSARNLPVRASRLADKTEMLGLFEHLETALDDSGFMRIQEKRPIMVRNLRNILQRATLTEQEVRTLRGVINALRGGDGKHRRDETPSD